MSVVPKVVVALVLAIAAFGAAYPADAFAEGGVLYVNEVRVVTFRNSLNNLSAARRAEFAAQSLWPVQRNQRVSLEQQDTSVRLVVGTIGIATVGVDDARAVNSTVESLARQWADQINEAIALQPLEARVANVTVAPGIKDGFVLVGALARKASVTVSDPNLARVERSTGRVEIVGRGVGSTEIVIVNGGLRRTIPVIILPLAASFPQNAVAEVLGSPATNAVVEHAARAAVRRQLQVPNGATVRVLAVQANQIGSGARSRVGADVEVTAPGYYPSKGRVFVDVANIGVWVNREERFFYSNYPESMDEPQKLYWGNFSQTPTRLLYHHRNKSSRPMTIRAAIYNPSSESIKVALISGDGDPSQNPTLAGFQAADRFLSQWLARTANVVEVPAGQVVPIALRRLSPGETMSGISAFHTLGGGEAEILIDSQWAENIPIGWRIVDSSATPWATCLPLTLEQSGFEVVRNVRHVYDDAFKSEEFTYSVGGRYGFVRIGQNHLVNANGDFTLFGNFGIIYFIEGKLTNPTGTPVSLDLIYEASAGYGPAVFTIDGQYYRVPFLQAKQEHVMRQFVLQPNETRTVRLTTIPLSGASYPCTITVRPTDDRIN